MKIKEKNMDLVYLKKECHICAKYSKFKKAPACQCFYVLLKLKRTNVAL